MAVITRTNEAQGKSCCDIVKVDSSDTMASYLANKLTEGDYVIFTTKDGVEGKTIEISLNAAALSGAVASPNDKVKAHLADPNAAGYLYDKLTTNPSGTIIVKKNGTNSLVYFDIELDVTELNDVVSSGLSNGGILVYDNASEKWVCSYALEGTFSGTTSKVPNSNAVADLLRNLFITDAIDCGSGGGYIMWKTISLPVTNCCINQGGQADFVDNYPSTFASVDLLENQRLTFAERGFGLKLITTESNPSNDGDGFGAVMLEAMIDEDCADNNVIFLDVVVQTKNNSGNDAQTNLKCVAAGLNEGQSIQTDVEYEKILDAAGVGLYKKVSFEMDLGGITAGSPFAIKFFLCSGSALIAPNAGYACMDEFTLLSARVRYPINTINLRSADINM